MVVATFVDILIARRLWNGKGIDYNTIQYAMFLVLREIRGKSAIDCATFLATQLEKDAPEFSANQRFGLWQSHKKTIRRFLARMTAWLDAQVGTAGTLVTYLKSTGAQGYDIEHIMADVHSRYEGEFPAPVDFAENRNRLGGLLLLPRSINRSLSSLNYLEKREKYLTQNMLAQTLHPSAYANNPALKRVNTDLGIPFHSHEDFQKVDLDERQAIYLKIAEAVWNPVRLITEAGLVHE